MSLNPDQRQRFVHRAVLLLLLAGALGGVLATVLHYSQAAPQVIDLVLPPTLSAVLFCLFVYLYRHPGRYLAVLWTAFICGLIGLAIPAWFYSIVAWRNPGATLIGILPPIAALLPALIMGLILFMRPRQLMISTVLAWLSIGAPILVYLAFHPAELESPRGLDLVMTLGPVMLMVMIFIRFHRGIEQWVLALEAEGLRMQALAERDALTGLYNRRAGENFLLTLLARPEPSDALILFDLDRFKNINDTHGHPVGDTVLREVAERCGAVLRKGDVFARWGGEEFLVLVRGPGDEGIVRVAEDLRLAISATPIAVAGTVTASFGVARFRPRDTMASWIQRADEALYEAKGAGRDRVVGH